ncbi:MAG: cyclic pyranopterin monophosphate synthase MoaC [Acidimicrobiia bacterium]
MSDLSHIDDEGNAHMVDIGAKGETDRVAVAVATVIMAAETRDLVFGGNAPKGDVLATTRIAGIQAAKQTSTLIPLCHPLPLSKVTVDIDPVENGARISVTASVTAKTGVEMEAMTGASVAALAMYDMIKGVDRGASVSSVELLHKSGGASGTWDRGATGPDRD